MFVELNRTSGPRSVPWAVFPDPMGEDRPDDENVHVTRRGIARVALVASEAAARFERHGSGEDTMDWMRRPNPLFDGRTALDACSELDACSRGVLVHMLDLDPAVDVRELDHVASQDPFGTGGEDDPGPARLYSCTVAHGGEDGRMWAFNAFVASGPRAARRVLASRHGERLSSEATIVEGFDRHDPYVAALVSTRLAEAIELAAADPCGHVAAGLDVSVVQRLDA